MRRVRIHEAAAQEAIEAAAWYEFKRPGLGNEFLRAIDAALAPSTLIGCDRSERGTRRVPAHPQLLVRAPIQTPHEWRFAVRHHHRCGQCGAQHRASSHTSVTPELGVTADCSILAGLLRNL